MPGAEREVLEDPPAALAAHGLAQARGHGSAPRAPRRAPSGSSGGTSRPVTPGTTISAMAPTSLATTGSSCDIASMITLGKPSRSPSRGDAGRQAEQVGAAQGRQHLLLRAGPAPGDPLADAQPLGADRQRLRPRSPPPTCSKRQLQLVGQPRQRLEQRCRDPSSRPRARRRRSRTGRAGSPPSPPAVARRRRETARHRARDRPAPDRHCGASACRCVEVHAAAGDQPLRRRQLLPLLPVRDRPDVLRVRRDAEGQIAQDRRVAGDRGRRVQVVHVQPVDSRPAAPPPAPAPGRAAGRDWRCGRAAGRPARPAAAARSARCSAAPPRAPAAPAAAPGRDTPADSGPVPGSPG